MRRVVVGLGTDERSAIVADGPPRSELLRLSFEGGRIGSMRSEDIASLPEPASLQPGEYAIGQLWLAEDGSREFVPGAGSWEHSGSFSDWATDRQPGSLSWTVVVFGPGTETGLHRTPTVDLNFVAAGEVELTTESGRTRLGPGDCAVVPGVAHAWRASPDGCTLICTAIATGRPLEADSS